MMNPSDNFTQIIPKDLVGIPVGFVPKLSKTTKALLATLAFYAHYPGWHTFNHRDTPTWNAVQKLVDLGYLETKSFQAQFRGKVFSESPTMSGPIIEEKRRY